MGNKVRRNENIGLWKPGGKCVRRTEMPTVCNAVERSSNRKSVGLLTWKILFCLTRVVTVEGWSQRLIGVK